jgi:hypothetical protein
MTCKDAKASLEGLYRMAESASYKTGFAANKLDPTQLDAALIALIDNAINSACDGTGNVNMQNAAQAIDSLITWFCP